MVRPAIIAGIVVLATSAPIAAQVPKQPGPQPGDGASVESVLTALYATVTRAKGQPFDWPRMRGLFLPGAQLVPASYAGTGEVQRYTVESFVTMIDESWARSAPLGSDRDQGFFERQVNTVKEQYGNIAMAFSTYEKGLPVPGARLTKGINTVQLVRSGGRW